MDLKQILRRIIGEFTLFGSLVFSTLFLIAIFFLQPLEIFLKFFYALLVAYFCLILIRIFYFRERPKKMAHENFLEKIDASSFPSLHAARATLILLFISLNFSFQKIFLYLLFAVYLLTLYSRISLRKHRLTDILGGIILGSVSYVIFF